MSSFYKTVFQNQHFIIADKAANVLSVPTRMGADDERPCLGIILEKDLNTKIFPVHRLDYEVQGLIIYALTPAAQKAGNAWFEQKTIQKIYSAITTTKIPNGFPLDQKLTWECVLERGKKRAFIAAHGKKSLTLATLKSISENGHFHWEMEPVTGRSHQLRFELFRHHHPIVGDQLYGSTETFTSAGIALRAFKIDFRKTPNREQFFLPEILETYSL